MSDKKQYFYTTEEQFEGGKKVCSDCGNVSDIQIKRCSKCGSIILAIREKYAKNKIQK